MHDAAGIADVGTQTVSGSGVSTVRIAVGVAIFIASVFAFDRLASTSLDRLYSAVEQRGQLEQKLTGLKDKEAYQILILGTSRTFEAVHPALIEREVGVKAFKEASKGKSLRYNYEFYQRYRRIVGRPRLVIYGVDYFIFGLQTERQLMRRFGIEEHPRPAGTWHIPLQTVENKGANDRAIVRMLERLQERAASAMGEFDPENNVEDMQSYTGETTSRIIERDPPASYRKVGFARLDDGPEGEYFSRLLLQWEQDGVSVLFVYPPDYIATYRTNYQYDAFVEYFRGLIARRANCVFVGYNDPTRFPLSTAAYFWDGEYGNPNSHLSKAGAERFNALLVPDIRKMLDNNKETEAGRQKTGGAPYGALGVGGLAPTSFP